jgi:hypothetical protein
MIPAVRSWTRHEMMKRVAFFKDLKGSKTGLPDSDLPECERELINVIGFQPPDNEGDVVSPVGAAAARLSAIPISEGFNLGFARCKPGRGRSCTITTRTRRSCRSPAVGVAPGTRTGT